jgi:hypothetical protein
VGTDRLVDDLVVLVQRPHHQIGRFLPHPRASLHVGEDEGDDAVEEAGLALGGLARVYGSRHSLLLLARGDSTRLGAEKNVWTVEARP